jgi:hypothetical protein
MIHPVSRSVVRRVLSVATVLTLVDFAASMDLQPDSALAAPRVSADLAAGVSYLADDDNGNHDENGNNDENRNNDENNNENNGNTGGQGIFSTICSVPGFASNAGCATGLLGN